MDRTADLDAALRFVIRRIEEEATRSGEPLTDEQRHLLSHLPKDSVLPQGYASGPEDPVLLIPRDTTYERLCGVAKVAHTNDVKQNPASALDWEFAASVSRLNRHPISWLLHSAGVKEHRPWWDAWLLVAAALLFILLGAVVMLLAGQEPWSRLQWTEVCVGCVTIFVLMYFASRRIEEWQLNQTIERCRRSLNFPAR